MATTEVWTFEDAVDFVLDAFGSERSARNVRNAKRAVINALNDIQNRRNWRYYYKRQALTTVAPYGTGTVAYDHTGGSNERQVTLTGGTFPAWAEFATLKIARKYYTVESRISDTVLTLSPNANPGEDLASTAYSLFRDNYPLPVDFLALDRLVDITGVGAALTYVSPGDYHQAARLQQQAGMPTYYTVSSSPDYRGTNSLFLGPPPSGSRSYEYMYRSSPRQLRCERYATGTVSVSSGSTTVTGSGTAFTDTHVGAVIRFSVDSNQPTSIIGGLSADENPFYAHRTVLSVESSDSLTIDAVVSNSVSLSGVGYTISDPIDIEAPVMLVAFQRLAELHMATLENADPNKIAFRARQADEALRNAASADIPTFGTNSQQLVGPLRIRDIATSVNQS